MRRLLAALAVCTVTAVLAGFAPPAFAAPPVTYVEPVTGRVVDPFRPPESPYGSGNRGLEYETADGSVARASASGRVTFAGTVGGERHVVVQHADGVRTSYSFLKTLAVRQGQALSQSDTVGTTGRSFHFGARIGDAYIDPAILLASGPARVHLIPDGEFRDEPESHDTRSDRSAAPGGQRAPDAPRYAGTPGARAPGYSGGPPRADAPGYADVPSYAGASTDGAWFHEPGASNDQWAMFSVVNDALGAVSLKAWEWARAGGSAVMGAAEAIGAGAIDFAQLAAGTASEGMRLLAEHLITILDEVVDIGQWAGPFAALAAALADILQAFLEPCTPPEQEPPPMPDSPHRVAVFVAGLASDSSGREDPGNLSRSFGALDTLGYAPGNVYDFSYRGGRHPVPYEPADTTHDIRARARDLRALLDQVNRAHPGAVVDVIAHSQGGLIAREALAHDYDSAEHTLPTVAHVVTLGTPHHGADAATANAWLRWSAEGRMIRRLAKKHHKAFDLTGPGVAQLSETSDFIRTLNDRPLREGVAYTSIGGAEDAIAPAVRTRLAGAANVLVDSGTLKTSHSGLRDSPAAQRELRLAIADAPATCQRLRDTAARAFTSAGIAVAEDAAAGAAVATVGAITPQP